jgi:hypothetical protein
MAHIDTVDEPAGWRFLLRDNDDPSAIRIYLVYEDDRGKAEELLKQKEKEVLELFRIDGAKRANVHHFTAYKLNPGDVQREW